MAPALILAVYERTQKDRAEDALLLLETVRAATGVSWLAKGGDLYRKTVERFQRLAGFGEAKQADDVKANRKTLLASLGRIGITAKTR